MASISLHSRVSSKLASWSRNLRPSTKRKSAQNIPFAGQIQIDQGVLEGAMGSNSTIDILHTHAHTHIQTHTHTPTRAHARKDTNTQQHPGCTPLETQKQRERERETERH